MSKSIELSGVKLIETLTDESLAESKTRVGGSLFREGENHELLKQSGGFGGLKRSDETGYYAVSFKTNEGSSISRYVSRGNMIVQVEDSGKITKKDDSNKIEWGTLNWKCEDGELLLIV